METKIIDTLEDHIQAAIEKMQVPSIKELAKYLTMDDGSRMHHLNIEHFKSNFPEEFKKLLKEHIIDNPSPEIKPMRRLGKEHKLAQAQKSQINVQLKKHQVNRLLIALRDSDNPDIQDILNVFMPYQSFSQVQKLMNAMVREGKVDKDLIDAYVKMVEERQVDDGKDS